jgi:hypothetical protein
MLVVSGRRRVDDSDQTILSESFCRREVVVSDEERADIMCVDMSVPYPDLALSTSKRNRSGKYVRYG